MWEVLYFDGRERHIDAETATEAAILAAQFGRVKELIFVGDRVNDPEDAA